MTEKQRIYEDALKKKRDGSHMSKNAKYDPIYDSYYDKRTNEWLESACDDPNCSFCKNRPTKHT